MTAKEWTQKDYDLATWKILLLAQIGYLMKCSAKLDLPTLAKSKMYPESTEFKTTISSRLNGRVIPRKKRRLLTHGLFGPGRPEFDLENSEKYRCKADKRKIWGLSPDGKTWYLGEVSAISNTSEDEECHQIVSLSLENSTIDEVIANVHPMVIIEKIRELVQSIWHQLTTELQDFELQVLTPVCSLWSRAENWSPKNETSLGNVVIRISELDVASLSNNILNNCVTLGRADDGFVCLYANLCKGENLCKICGRIYTGKDCCKK